LMSLDKTTLQELHQPPQPVFPGPQLSSYVYKYASQESLGELFRQSGIDPGLLNPEELKVFHSKNLDAQQKVIEGFSRALRLLVGSGLDPNVLGSRNFTMFRGQDPKTQLRSIQLCIRSLENMDFLESLRKKRIEPALLTLGELMVFQPKYLDAQHNPMEGVLRARQLLAVNGIDPSGLTPLQFAAFKAQSSVIQILSCRLYRQSLAYSSRSAVAVPKAPTEKGIGSDQAAPQESTAFRIQDPWGLPNSRHSAPPLPESPTQSASYYTSSHDPTPSLDGINPSRLEPPNERFSLPDNLSGHAVDPASGGSRYDILEYIR
jgi:hypothetical protein